MPASETLILPGLGSPESPLYQAVYGLIAEEARRRDMATRCLTYKGHGHLADGRIEGEIALPGIAEAIVGEVKQAAAGSTLICRSFGCQLPGYLALNHGVKWDAFRRIVLWGPVPYFHMWRLFGTPSRLAERNSEAQAKGARLSPAFFDTLVPLEICCEALVDTEVVIAVGTEDAYTTLEFAELLASIIRKNGTARVKVETVAGAPHEMTKAQGESVRAAYSNALFG